MWPLCDDDDGRWRVPASAARGACQSGRLFRMKAAEDARASRGFLIDGLGITDARQHGLAASRNSIAVAGSG